jgi:hypothetical protein
MGVVWLADQEQPIRRTVAIKVVKLGADSDRVLSRFDSERQALAILNHPHIAKIFDAGGCWTQFRPAHQEAPVVVFGHAETRSRVGAVGGGVGASRRPRT